jgi:hypothetical protein
MTRQKLSLSFVVVAVLIGALLGSWATTATTSVGGKKIRRTILLNFKPAASPAEIQQVLRDVKANITQIKGVRRVIIGPQINQNASFQYGISMDFDDEAALKRYRQDEGHRDTHNKYVHLIEQSQITDLREE